MKKNYPTFLSVLILFIASNAAAQLSGIVTINSGASTAGTNYQSFTDLRNDLNSVGVNGPLTVNVVANSGPYNEQVDFPAISGVNASNTITVNGNGCLLSFSANSSAPWTLGLDGADYMTFNNLRIEGLHKTYALTVHLWNDADNNAFNTCTVTTVVNTDWNDVVVPVSISQDPTSARGGYYYYYYSYLGGGRDNTFTGCQVSGGNFGICFYADSSPYNIANSVLNCSVRDFYAVGIYNYQHTRANLRGNTMERPTQAVSDYCYGILIDYSCPGSVIEGNLIHKLFESCPGDLNDVYGIYLASSSSTSIVPVQNNIISITKTNGRAYGIYAEDYNNVLHNTISIGEGCAGSNRIRAIWGAGTANLRIRNNIVSVTHPGTGIKHCLYYSSGTIVSNYNDLYMSSGGTTNYTGRYNATNHVTLANWKAANALSFDQNSWNANPGFIAPPFGNFTPSSTTFNNAGLNLGLPVDYYNNLRGTSPDPGAIEFFNTACGGIPAAGSVIVPSGSICPNSTVAVGISPFYNTSNMTYQWESSTGGAFGPFNPISGATNQYLNTPPITTNTWFRLIATCIAGSSVALPSGMISVVPNVVSNVPYFEGFEGITAVNQLPNCNWAATNMPLETQTNLTPMNENRMPRTGKNYASFNYDPVGTKYFYSNGIQLYPGVTYSGSVWAIAANDYGYGDWSGVTLMVGPNQSPSGLMTIADYGSNFSNQVYTQLSNTFQVTSPGIYYAAIKATSSSSGYGDSRYLSWDDLEITIPCAYNPVSLSINTSTNLICSGQTVTVSVTGADTYSWNTGATSSSLVVTPSADVSYLITGTNTLTGCSNQNTSQYITVHQSPAVSIIASPLVSCSGKPVTLQASGSADTYTWSNGPIGSSNVVNPTTTTSYTLTGITTQNCMKQATVQIMVNPNPTVTASYPNQICQGEMATLTGSGANAFAWASSSSYLIANPAIVSPHQTTTYTLTGTDAAQCSGITLLTIIVDACTGLREAVIEANSLKVYPNPTSNEFTVELTRGTIQKVEVMDLTGRIVMETSSGQAKTSLNINTLSNGIYHVRVLTNENTSEVIKIVKQ